MKHFLIFAILLTSFSGTINAQTLSYSGTINYGKSTINYQIKLIEIKNQTKVSFSSIEMNAYEIPCQNVIIQTDTLKFYVVSDYFTYEYIFHKQNNNYMGKLKIYSNETEQVLNTFVTNLILEKSIGLNAVNKKEVTFISNGLTLCGTLWEPIKSNNIGLVFVTSSQGSDRSGTNAEAYYFTNLGYTVLNYDKRGTGKSEGNWQTATIEELCSDDINALYFFSKIAKIPLSETGIIGSSQGGIKIPYILTKLSELNFGISISCPSGTLLESDLNNWENINKSKIGKENIGIAIKIQKAAYDYLAGNITYEKMNLLIGDYTNQDWFKNIWIPKKNIKKDYKLNFSGLPYFRKITQPLLLIQGLSDDVIPSNSFKIIRSAIQESKSSKYKILTLKNTTHSMTYLNKEFPYFEILSPGYLDAITNWLNSIESK